MNAYTYWTNDIPFDANIYESLFFFVITLTRPALYTHETHWKSPSVT